MLEVAAIFIPVVAICGDSQDKIIFQGQIIARQQFEQMPQIGSFVENREHFLFRTNDNPPLTIKLVHRFYGYSDLEDKVLSRMPVLQISVKENYTCREAYEEFFKNASGYSEKWSKLFGEHMDPLKVFDKNGLRNVDGDTNLKCYVMIQRDYKVIAKSKNE